MELEEAIFNQKNISNIIRNILTLRYDPSQKPVLPILKYDDFLPSKKLDLNFIETTLANSLKNKLVSTNNLAISLSGGIDSTLVLALLRNTFPEIKINAFSIKFSNSVDETPDAKKIANFFEAEHEVIFVENYLLDLPTAISITGLPFWDIHWYYVAKKVQNKFDFLASGDGGDELFSGYVFRYSKFLSMINSQSSVTEKIKAYLLCHERDWVPYQENIFNKKSSFSWNVIYSIFEPFFNNSLSLLNQVFLADYNGKLLYNFSIISTRINNYFNLESITPLLSPEIISYATHLSPELKYNVAKNIGKIPLRQLLVKYNCDSLISKEKLGFSVNTINLWNSNGRELCKSYLDNSRIVEDGWINKEWISNYINKSDLDVRYVNKFLGLLSQEIWYRIFITKEMSSKDKLS